MTNDATVAQTDSQGTMKTNDFTCMPGDPTGIGMPVTMEGKCLPNTASPFADHRMPTPRNRRRAREVARQTPDRQNGTIEHVASLASIAKFIGSFSIAIRRHVCDPGSRCDSRRAKICDSLGVRADYSQRKIAAARKSVL
jgi:hypothetical protein